MSFIRRFVVYGFAIAFAIVALAGAGASAQEANEEPVADSEDSETSEVIEEIIVYSPKPGDRKRLDDEYEDPVRAQLLKDFYEMQEDQEEFEWRKSAAEDDTSRISWGYDPKDEYEMRNSLDLQDLPSERTKPATLFRVNF
jgi:hypothetical protein